MQMTCKKAAIALMVSSVAALSALAHADGGTIHFVGRIVEDTCQVSNLDQITKPANAQLGHCDQHIAQSARMSIQPVVQKTLIPVTSNAPTDAGKQQPKLAILMVEYR